MWQVVLNKQVKLVWRAAATCTAGNGRRCDTPMTVEQSPADLTHVGIPICQDCGADYEYMHTAVSQRRRPVPGTVNQVRSLLRFWKQHRNFEEGGEDSDGCLLDFMRAWIENTRDLYTRRGRKR